MGRRYFGTDGIRGPANAHPMTADIAMKAGMAAGHILNVRKTHSPRVVIGKDTRLSGYMIEQALTSGFAAAGIDVFVLGPMPTPAVAMLTRSLRADFGVMISASHNPYQDNGIKFFDSDGYKLCDDVELEIERLLDGPSKDLVVGADKIGRVKRIESAQERYIEFAKRTLPKDVRLDGLRIVVDCAHGAGYRVAPDALWELGAEVIPIGVEPNGRNINLNCGSTAPQALVDKVREFRADVGIGLDGDADRVVLVDEKGRIVDGDQTIAVIAESWNKRDTLAGGGVVATVMSNLGLENFIRDLGLDFARTPVGDRHVVEYMRKHGYNVGGEQSGHVVLSDYATTGDGLVTALQVLAVMVETQKPMSEVCHRFDPLPQLLKNVRYASGKPLDHDAVKKAIKGGEERIAKAGGRILIRASGTEPVIRVMAEGRDEAVVAQVVGDIVAAVQKAVAA